MSIMDILRAVKNSELLAKDMQMMDEVGNVTKLGKLKKSGYIGKYDTGDEGIDNIFIKSKEPTGGFGILDKIRKYTGGQIDEADSSLPAVKRLGRKHEIGDIFKWDWVDDEGRMSPSKNKILKYYDKAGNNSMHYDEMYKPEVK